MPARGNRWSRAVAVVALVVAGSHARAENFLDFGIGANFVSPDTLKLDEESGPDARDSMTFDPSLSLRFRVGSFFETTPWLGAAASISYFEAEGGNIERNHIVPVSGLVLFRLPLLPDPEFPGGRLYPYAGFGPSVVFSNTKVESFDAVDDDVDHGSIALGVEVQAGVAYHLTQRVRVFLEYGLTYFHQDVDEGDFEIDLFGSDRDTSAEVDIVASQILFGVSLTF